MDQVNLKRLAKELNLAVSTVSRALSDSYDISAETKARVLALAKELDYQPNPYARSLRNRRSKTIAIIVPEIANNFFSLAINGIEEIAQENGYHVLIYLTHEDHRKEAAFAQHLLNGRVDGILMSVSSQTDDTSHIRRLIESGIPVVFFDRVCQEIDTVKVTTDDYKGGYEATQHLISADCRNIAYVAFSKSLSIDQKRMQGFADALKDNGRTPSPGHIVHCGNNAAENKMILRRLLASPNRPDGIFASVESLAMLCYEVCHETGLRIPQDIKILGFSNLKIASLLNPPLTTITQPAFDIGKEAAKALFQAFGKKAIKLEHKEIMLISTLIERESTRGIKEEKG